MVKDIDNAQKVKSRVEREFEILIQQAGLFLPLARISSSTNSQRAIESSKKKPGCFAEEEERQGCWEEELPGVPSERKQSSKEERSPENSGKGSSPQPPGQQLHLFWILSISDYHVSKEKDQITFTQKDQGWSETGTSLPLLLLGNGVEGSGSPRKEQSGGHPSFTFAIWFLGIFWGKEDYKEIKFSGSHQRRGDARVAMMLVLLLFFRLDWQK